jgi:hypothetical protein
MFECRPRFREEGLEKEQRSAIHALMEHLEKAGSLKTSWLLCSDTHFSVSTNGSYIMTHNLAVMNQPKKAVNDPGDFAD